MGLLTNKNPDPSLTNFAVSSAYRYLVVSRFRIINRQGEMIEYLGKRLEIMDDEWVQPTEFFSIINKWLDEVNREFFSATR